MANTQSGRLGLGLKPETETLLMFGGIGISVTIGTYTACQVLPNHEIFIAAIGLMGISLLAGAYKKEVKKEQVQTRTIENEVIQVKNHVYTIKSQ